MLVPWIDKICLLIVLCIHVLNYFIYSRVKWWRSGTPCFRQKHLQAHSPQTLLRIHLNSRSTTPFPNTYSLIVRKLDKILLLIVTGCFNCNVSDALHWISLNSFSWICVVWVNCYCTILWINTVMGVVLAEWVYFHLFFVVFSVPVYMKMLDLHFLLLFIIPNFDCDTQYHVEKSAWFSLVMFT